MSPRVFLITVLLTLWSQTGAAQSLYAEKPLGEIEKSMEANLTWNLQNALLVYYPETKFVVNAKVKLAKVEPRRKLPRLPDALLKKDLTNLPGLPYLPEAFQKPPEQTETDLSLSSSASKGHYQVQRMLVNVLVDRSLSQSDWSFIRRFVTLTANLEPLRGDQVRIEGLTFPEKAAFFLEPAKPDEQAMIPPVPDAKTEKAGFDWLPYLFAAGLAVFLLILFLVGQRNLAKYLKQSAVPPLTSPAEQALGDTGLRSREPAKSQQPSQPKAALGILKSSAIDAIVGTPAASAKVFGRWIEEKGDTGISDVAIVLVTVSRFW